MASSKSKKFPVGTVALFGLGAFGVYYLLARKSEADARAKEIAEIQKNAPPGPNQLPPPGTPEGEPAGAPAGTPAGTTAEASPPNFTDPIQENIVAAKLRAAGYPAFAERIEARHRALPLKDANRNLPLASWLKKALTLLGIWDGDISENWNNPSVSGPNLLTTLAALQRSRYLMANVAMGTQPFAPNGHFDTTVLDAVVRRLNEKGYLSLVPLPVPVKEALDAYGEAIVGIQNGVGVNSPAIRKSWMKLADQLANLGLLEPARVLNEAAGRTPSVPVTPIPMGASTSGRRFFGVGANFPRPLPVVADMDETFVSNLPSYGMKG